MTRLVYAALFAAMAFVLPGSGGSGTVADHADYHDEDEDEWYNTYPDASDTATDALDEAREREQERRIQRLEDEVLMDDLTGGAQTNVAQFPAGGVLPPPAAVSFDDLRAGGPVVMPPEHTFVTVCQERQIDGPDAYGYVQTVSICMLARPLETAAP